MSEQTSTRREFLGRLAAGITAGGMLPQMACAGEPSFRLRHILGSCLYGTAPLAEILPEVAKSGAKHIDVWPRVHGNQREQIDEMGHEAFAGLLEKHGVVVVHGRAYGETAEGMLRLSFAAGGDTLHRGLELLRNGLAAL